VPTSNSYRLACSVFRLYLPPRSRRNSPTYETGGKKEGEYWHKFHMYGFRTKQKRARTHLRFTLDLIILFRFSVVTNVSSSSLNENIAGGSFNFRLRHNCRITSSTAKVGSMRARTVTPSFVVTWFVGTTAFPCFVPLWFGLGPLWTDEFASPGRGFDVAVAITDRIRRG